MNPENMPEVEKLAEMPAKTSKRKLGKSLSLPEKQAIEDDKKAKRMELAQAKADRMLKDVRESGLEDLQPAVGFTAKCHDCK